MDELAKIAWEGDSLDVLRSFPKGIQGDLGAELFRLQAGEKPVNSRPMKSIGARVYELKERDAAGWYRVIYLAKIANTVHVLHSFKKQSAKTSKKDLSVAREPAKGSSRAAKGEQAMTTRTKTATKPTHVTTGNVFIDLNFSPDEAAVMALKVQLHIEIMKAVKRQKLSPRQLEKVLDVPQPRVSELLGGKLSKMTSDKLTKYLSRLGRNVQIKTKKIEGTEAA